MLSKNLLDSFFKESKTIFVETGQVSRCIIFTDIPTVDSPAKVFYIDIDDYFTYNISKNTLKLAHRYHQDKKIVVFMDLIDLKHILAVRLVLTNNSPP